MTKVVRDMGKVGTILGRGLFAGFMGDLLSHDMVEFVFAKGHCLAIFTHTGSAADLNEEVVHVSDIPGAPVVVTEEE